MQTEEHYAGERLCLKGQNCTVRYIGPVADKAGRWLGVEWDDPSRGKHNGTHDGVSYFTCRSKSPNAASFLRPHQPWDPPRTFLQALKEKYMPDFHEDGAEIVYFSGKQAEEIGFDKFHERQAKLRGIHVLVLDHMRIKHGRASQKEDDASIAEVCADITELDLGSNLSESFEEIVDLCYHIPKLRNLTLAGNRLSVSNEKGGAALDGIRSLSLTQTLLLPHELNKVVSLFPSLETLDLANNELTTFPRLNLPLTLGTLDLSDNDFHSLSDLRYLTVDDPLLHTLMLKRNQISTIDSAKDPDFSVDVIELDLSYNAIEDWSFFNSITKSTFRNLKHLRVTGNPLYKNLTSAQGKPLAAEDGYMLTIARLPQLESLNYAKITEKERLNAETYYLSQIAIELSNTPEDRQDEVIAQHPRYRALCEEYGEPTLHQKPNKDAIDPNTLAARLVTVTFMLAPTTLPHIKQRMWEDEIPKSFDVYALLGIVGKRLGVVPLDLRLVLESNERDPVGRDSGFGGPKWWDSSDDEADGEEDVGAWIEREVELVAGTRAVGTYVEGLAADIRVELRQHDNQ